GLGPFFQTGGSVGPSRGFPDRYVVKPLIDSSVLELFSHLTSVPAAHPGGAPAPFLIVLFVWKDSRVPDSIRQQPFPGSSVLASVRQPNLFPTDDLIHGPVIPYSLFHGPIV